MNKARCFVSYCSEDAKVEQVAAIVKHLTRLAKSKDYNIEFLFDKNLSVGNDLNVFMNEIKDVDSVIVICTPEYKRRSEDDTTSNTGVYKESMLIKERISKREEALKGGEDIDEVDFAVFPLVFKLEGNHSSDSVPDFLSSLEREKINLIQFENVKNKLILSKNSEEVYKDIFLDCIVTTCVIHSKKSEYLSMDIHEKLQKIVYNQKAEYAPSLSKKLFVNTFSYEQIRSQESYILVGRKGSGKTTTKLYFHSHDREKYKGVIELKINELNLEYIYNYLFHGPADANHNLKTDFQEIFSFEKVMEYTWVVYIYVYSMYVVSCEYKNKKNTLSPKQNREFKKVAIYVNEIIKPINSRYRWKNGRNISTTLYSYALTNVYKFFDIVIQKSRDDERFFSSDIQAQLSYENLISEVLDNKVVSAFYRGLEECNKRILFTLDGFDVASGIFRKQALSSDLAEQKQKAMFEIRWMSSLMELIQDIKADVDNILYRLMDICFLMPKDLFMEILEENRDKYKYSSRFCEISWTGMELAIMVRKRLECLSEYPLLKREKAQKRPEDILDMILTKSYKSLPKKISIRTDGGRSYEVDLLLYMLRYSFWRPRDLLLSLSLILKLYYSHSKSGLPINQETIKAIIKAASISIVNSEFFNEFGTMWKQIKENIKKFEGKTLLLSEDDLQDIIMANNFTIQLDAEDEEIKDYKERVKFLYEIGFLGIFVTKRYSDKYQMVTQQGFAFSEGMRCLRGFLVDDFEDCSFLINPTFIETLHLSINTEEYIGINNWDDLRELERRIQIKMKTDCFGGTE